MENNFDQRLYIKYLGEELISEFSRASMMTQPVAIGSGREQSAKQKLKLILSAGVGIGSGFIIDSYGNTSKQYQAQITVQPTQNNLWS